MSDQKEAFDERAAIIQFFGGIHEIYFPYVLMKPLTLIATISGGIVGIGLTAADSYRRDDLGIDTVLIIIDINLRLLRLFSEADDTKPKVGLDVCFGCSTGFAAAPCWIAEVAYFQEHGKR